MHCRCFSVGSFGWKIDLLPSPVYSHTHTYTQTRKLEVTHKHLCTPIQQTHRHRDTHSHVHTTTWFTGGSPQNLSSVSWWWCRINGGGQRNVVPVRILSYSWVRSVNKPVLTWPQLVMDAISLFKTPVLSLSVCTAHHSLPKPAPHSPWRKGWSNSQMDQRQF